MPVSKIIEMVYQNGVFKPLKKVELKEGEVVKVDIKEAKKVTERFYSKLEEIKKESKKVKKAYSVLEEVRDARY